MEVYLLEELVCGDESGHVMSIILHVPDTDLWFAPMLEHNWVHLILVEYLYDINQTYLTYLGEL